MRIVFFIILLAGFGCAGYPWVSQRILEHSIGTWRVYNDATGFLPAQPRLQESDAPLRVVAEMTTTGISSLPEGALLTVTVSKDGKTVLAEALDFASATVRDTNPQTQEKVFSQSAGMIDNVESGTYTVAFGKGDAESANIRSVDLILVHVAPALDSRLQPIGYSLIAIGFIGFMLSFRRGGGTPQNPNSQPPPPKWGRAGNQS